MLSISIIVFFPFPLLTFNDKEAGRKMCLSGCSLITHNNTSDSVLYTHHLLVKCTESLISLTVSHLISLTVIMNHRMSSLPFIYPSLAVGMARAISRGHHHSNHHSGVPRLPPHGAGEWTQEVHPLLWLHPLLHHTW